MSMIQVSRYIMAQNPMWAWPIQLLRGVVYQLQKRLFKQRCMHRLFNSKKIYLYPDCPISSQFMYARIPDKDEIDSLRQATTPETCFLDIGANMGAYSIMMLDKTQNIIAFEPDATSFTRLTENFKINSCACRLETLALSNYHGQGVLTNHQGSPSNQLLSDGEEGQMVQVTTLDQYAQTHDLSSTIPYLLKIDVEGEELRVLQGAKYFLSHFPIQGILLESFPDNVVQVKALLNELGFEVQRVSHHNYWAVKC